MPADVLRKKVEWGAQSCVCVCVFFPPGFGHPVVLGMFLFWYADVDFVFGGRVESL